jgi:predicted HD phosphohydrolase
MSIEKRVDELFSLFDDFGNDDYLGELISKSVHSIQCGLLAEQAGYDKSVNDKIYKNLNIQQM